MSKRQFLLLMFSSLALMFIFAISWEFFIEDQIRIRPEEFAESTLLKWEFILTSMVFVSLALIIPIWFGLKSINKHRATTQSLLDSEEKYREIFNASHENQAFLEEVIESLPYPFYVINAEDYRVVMANSAAGNVSGDKSISCHRLTHGQDTPCDSEDHPCPLEITKNTGKPARVNHIHNDADGNPYRAEVHSYPIFGKSGKVEKIIEYSIDISERELAREKLEEALKIQKVMFQLAETKSVRQNLSSLCQSIHHALSDVMDTKNFYIALVEDDAKELIFPYFVDETDDAPGRVKFKKGLSEFVITSGQSLFIKNEEIFQMRDQGRIEFLGSPSEVWLGVPLAIEQQIVGVVVVQSYADENAFSDKDLSLLEFVSKQIADAIVTNRMEKALREERALLTTLMHNSVDTLYFKDLESRFIKVSDSQAKLLKLSNADLAKGTTDFDYFLEEHASKAFNDEQEIIKTKTPLIGQEERLVFPGKPDTWVSTTKLPLLDENGDALGTFGITRDITISKLAEKTLEESDSLKELLLDIITHDLKNPAGVIYGLSEIVLGEDPDSEIIEGIFQASQRLLRVLENTTALAQATTGEKIPLQDLDFNRLLDDVAAEFSQRLDEMEMTLKINIPENTTAPANPIIEEVFKNYVSNAIKYASSGKEISIDATIQKGGLVFAVKDLGSTIPEVQRDHVFERHAQLAEGKKHGRGLGLAIVKRITTAHGGDCWVEPNMPTGNSFCLRIPYEDSTL